MAGGVLDEYGAEALHRTERCTVNHDGTVLLVVASGVFEFEAFGQVVIDLNGAQLPAAADGVFDHEVKFGTVEGSLTSFLACRKSLLFAGFDDGLFGFGPNLVATDVLLLVVRVTQ